MYKCQRVESYSFFEQPKSPDAVIQNNQENKLVVKVCDTSDPGVLNSIRNEQKILSKLDCQCVNKVYAYYEDPERNSAYLVLEYVGN